MIYPDIVCETRDADSIVDLLEAVGVEVQGYYPHDQRPSYTHITIKVGNMDAVEFILAGLYEQDYRVHYE
jgi:hypothetical protein